MKIEQIITKEEIEEFRTPDEFINWFDFIHRRLISFDFERNTFMRRFEAEVVALYIFLKRNSKRYKNSKFRNIIGDQKYDVEVCGCKDFSKIEILDGDIDKRQYLNEETDFEEGIVSVQLNKTLEKLELRIEKKLGKDYTNETALLVVINDIFANIPHPSFRSQYLEMIDKIKEKYKDKKGGFPKIFFQGRSYNTKIAFEI